MKELNIDDKMFTERSFMSEISKAKNDLVEPEEYAKRTNNEIRKEVISNVYTLYQKKAQGK